MMKKRLSAFLVLLLCVTVSLSGCETLGSSAGVAFVSAGIGAILGHQSGHALEGAAIGAVVGVAAAAITHDIRNSRQVKSAEETQKQHNDWAPDDGIDIKIESATLTPQLVHANDRVSSKVEYALLGAPSGGVEVYRAFSIVDENKKVQVASSKKEKKGSGTWDSEVSFTVTEALPPGTYTLEQVIALDRKDNPISKAATSHFTVATDHAGNVTIVESSPEILAAMNN